MWRRQYWCSFELVNWLDFSSALTSQQCERRRNQTQEAIYVDSSSVMIKQASVLSFRWRGCGRCELGWGTVLAYGVAKSWFWQCWESTAFWSSSWASVSRGSVLPVWSLCCSVLASKSQFMEIKFCEMIAFSNVEEVLGRRGKKSRRELSIYTAVCDKHPMWNTGSYCTSKIWPDFSVTLNHNCHFWVDVYLLCPVVWWQFGQPRISGFTTQWGGYAKILLAWMQMMVPLNAMKW